MSIPNAIIAQLSALHLDDVPRRPEFLKLIGNARELIAELLEIMDLSAAEFEKTGKTRSELIQIGMTRVVATFDIEPRAKNALLEIANDPYIVEIFAIHRVMNVFLGLLRAL